MWTHVAVVDRQTSVIPSQGFRIRLRRLFLTGDLASSRSRAGCYQGDESLVMSKANKRALANDTSRVASARRIKSFRL